jgi:nicotinate-nucleotide adenylyltransferase
MAGELRIGILGGIFDPIHYGHLTIAEEARYHFALKEVLFVPCGNPPHKQEQAVTEVKHRLAMTHLALADNPAFRLSSVELDRPGLSYAIDTIELLQQEYGGARLYFIVGADAILELETWKEPQRLVEACEVVAATRPGYSLAGLEAALGREIASKIKLLEPPGVAISSREIRQRVRQGAPIKYLVPGPVAQYIADYKLYL